MVYYMESSVFDEIELPNAFAEQLLIHEDSLYMRPADIVSASINSSVTILNQKNMKMASFDLMRKVWQIEVKDNLLYALDLENRIVFQVSDEEWLFC